jgi:NAD(P)-dependent dehydrogenase (short-subunit alcohol dehydrogenase family)
VSSAYHCPWNCIEHETVFFCSTVAAAGIAGTKAPPEGSDAHDIKETLWDKETPEAWSTNFNTNVTSVYFSTVALLPLLQASPRELTPSVIVISSMSGFMRHSQGHFSYNAGKAAVAHLSTMMSREFHQIGVRVNSIAPGYFPSEQTMGESDERQKSHMPKEKVQDKGHPVPAGRPGKDEEMAQAVLFLAKCGYVTGEIIKLDGGVMNEVGQS